MKFLFIISRRLMPRNIQAYHNIIFKYTLFFTMQQLAFLFCISSLISLSFMVKLNMLTVPAIMRNYLFPLHLITKQETITTAKSDQNDRIKLKPYTPLLSQSFLDSLNRRSRKDFLDDLFDYSLNYTNYPLLKG